MNPDPIKDETPPAAAAPVPPSTAGMTTRVVKGSLWTLAGQVAPLGISLFTTPFVIRLLGSEGYGVLILVGLIPTYFAFADLGMGIASTKFASEAYAAGDAEREAATVNTAAAMSFVLSIPIAALIFIFSDAAVGLFNVPDHFRTEANIALKLAAVTFVINFLNGIFNTPQLTRLRMDLNTFVSSGFRMLGLVATPVTIYLGGGIIGAAAVLLAVSMLTLAANLFVSGKLLNELLKFKLDRTAARPMLKFGLGLVGASAAALSLANLEKLILPGFTSVRTFAYYTVAFTFASMLTMFANSMIQSLIPAFSQLQGYENRSQLQSLYSRGIRLNLILLIPGLVALAITAKPFFTLWAGKEFGHESVMPFYILLSGLVFNIPAYLPYAAIMSAGRSDIFAKLYFAELIPYILLVTLFTWQFGILGAATAWSIRISIDGILQFTIAKKIAGLAFASDKLKKLYIAALVMIIPFILNIYLKDTRAETIVIFVISLGIYSAIIWTGVLELEERNWVRIKLRRNYE